MIAACALRPVCPRPTRYAKIVADPAAIENLFVDLFLDVHHEPPAEITLDLDATDDPLHGHQEGRFFHGYWARTCIPFPPQSQIYMDQPKINIS
jgi:hypothetical protein